MFCIRIRYAACAGAASTAPSSSRRAAVTRSSASRARTHWFRAAAMAALRWAAIVGPLTSMTLAPCARAIATVSSVEPPSATMTSSAQRSDASASAICHASLSVGITTVRGSEAGGTEGTGGARSGMTSSGCERSGLRLGCWSRGCPLIIQHAFRRHTVVMTTLLLAHDFPPLGGGIARLHGELARRYPAGELIVSTPQDPDAGDVDAQFNGAVDRLPVGRRTTRSLPGLLLWSRRAASLARQHHVRFVHCGNVKPAGYPARWVLERCRVPYSVFLYGADVLSEQHKIRQSVFKRRTARAVFGGAGFGLALVEASACGLPVVAGNSGGVPDAVRDGETGFLVPAEDPAAFADAICRLLADAELAKRMGAAGRRAVETYYNWDRVVRDLRAIEAEVVAR